MTKEEFIKFEEEFKELASKHIIDPSDRVSLLVRSMSDMSLSYSGTDCVACLGGIIQQGVDVGVIMHKGEIDSIDDENDDEIIKH